MAGFESARVLLTGSSGFLGGPLLTSLRARGFEVMRLVRGVATQDDEVRWNPEWPPPPETISGFDAIIHLAGETVAERWTAGQRARIRDSRVTGTLNLVHSI